MYFHKLQAVNCLIKFFKGTWIDPLKIRNPKNLAYWKFELGTVLN